MNNASEFIIKYRWFIIVFFIGFAIFMATQLPKAEVDAEVKNMMSPDVKSRLNTDKIEEIFGGTDMLIVFFKTDDVLNSKTLTRIKKISKKMNRLKGVDMVLSLFDLKSIKGEDGAMIVDPAVKNIPKTNEQREILRKEIIDNDLVYKSVVSEDFKLTAIILSITNKVSDFVLVEKTEKILEEIPGDEEVYKGGMPFTRVNVGNNIRGDMGRLMPAGLLIMLIFLFFAFKQLRGVALPFFIVIMSIFVAMGMIPVLGWKIQMITVLLPMILIAVANDYGIHLIAKYQEDNVVGNTYSKEDLAKRMFKSLAKPIVVTGVTTIAGMLCLLGHVIIPAEQIGILASVGILYALVASLLFIPAVTTIIRKSQPVIDNHNKGKHFLDRILLQFSYVISRKPKMIIMTALIFTLISALGIFMVSIDANPENYYEEDHPVVVSARLINENFGGSQNISILFNGDIKDPALMKKIDNYEHQLRALPEVGNTTSIARAVRQMSRALNDKGEKFYDKIPDSRNAIAQYFELYSMSGDPDDFEKLVDFPYKNALLTGRINTTSTPEMKNLVNKVETMTEGDKDVKLIGGWGLIFTELADLVIRGQMISLFLAIVIVSIMLMILFRSFVAGIISIIPLGMAMTILFGLMGIMGIELNIATAMLSSIMIGVGIDYTIHFLWRYKEERANGLDYADAVKKTLITTGRGITFNALSVIIGFSALLVSNFLPVRFFGFLVFVSILACLIGALIFIPALCIVLKPKFLEPK